MGLNGQGEREVPLVGEEVFVKAGEYCDKRQNRVSDNSQRCSPAIITSAVPSAREAVLSMLRSDRNFVPIIAPQPTAATAMTSSVNGNSMRPMPRKSYLKSFVSI